MSNKLSLVNFVRGCEPRYPRDLLTPTAEEMRIDKSYGFPHTFLLQYDAMIREDFRNLFLSEKDENTELGIWFEMSRPLNEKVGIEWRGRPGYDWDWYVNPGFLMAYTQEQRRALIDEAFRLFCEIFGYYPKVVGSWLLDAYSLSYMSEKYGIVAACICREQYAVDAYTLWGGYYSGGYYPSKNNILCPAGSDETKINVPVFRMLGADPIYCFDEKKYSPALCAYTLEPTWKSGSDEKVVAWFLNEYYNNPSVTDSFLTTGQENSFSWGSTGKGYRIQAEQIAKLRDSGKLSVQTLGQVGESFTSRFEQTPPSALSAFTDWSENGNQSVWFSCRNYRANLFNNNGRLFFRDIRKFDDSYRERYLDTPCTGWDAIYDNLPVIDGRLWSDESNECALTFSDKIKTVKPLSDADNTLIIGIETENGKTGRVIFTENGISVDTDGEWMFDFGTSPDLISGDNDKLKFRHNGFDYSITVTPAPERSAGTYTVIGKYSIKIK